MSESHEIKHEAELDALIGEPAEHIRGKIGKKLDPIMAEFIRQSPLIFVSTIDANGQLDVSPKGDPKGFVMLDDSGDLLIPERPGNKLLFGFRNILRNGEIGVMFIVPNQRESLRIKGTATLHRDPELLDKMQVNGKPALLYTRVNVTECHFHCGKALVRSKVWKPDSWNDANDSIGIRQYASLTGDSSKEVLEITKERLETSYSEALY